MPDPTRLLRTLERAIREFRASPGRRGRLIELEGAAEVLVVGDLHGHLENFRRVLDRAGLGQHPGRHLVLQELVHGPHRYPAGGDKSHQLLDLLAALKCQYPRQVHMLLGNHELAQWTGQAIAKVDSDLNASFWEGVATAYRSHADAIYRAYQELFAAVPLALRTANRVFLSHSLPSARRLERFDPGVLLRDTCDAEELRPGGSVYALVWGRDTRPETVAGFLEKVDADLLVSGHIPCPAGFEAPNDRQLLLDAQGTPAGYCLLPTDRPLTHAELLQAAATL